MSNVWLQRRPAAVTLVAACSGPAEAVRSAEHIMWRSGRPVAAIGPSDGPDWSAVGAAGGELLADSACGPTQRRLISPVSAGHRQPHRRHRTAVTKDGRPVRAGRCRAVAAAECYMSAIPAPTGPARPGPPPPARQASERFTPEAQECSDRNRSGPFSVAW